MKEKEYRDSAINRVVNPDAVGKFIAMLREKHNLTQQQLGDKIFISRKSVSKWENGNGLPSIDLLLPLSDVLNVSLEELLEGKFLSDDEPNGGIAGRILKSPRFRLSVILGSILMLFLILCFLIYHLNSVKLYTINYEDEDFTITNGMISFSNSECQISLGDFSSNLMNDHSYNFKFYLNDDPESSLDDKVIISFNRTSLTLKDRISCNEIRNAFNDKNVDKLYLKISYIDDVGDEVYYRLKLSDSITKKTTFKSFFENKDESLSSNLNTVRNENLEAIHTADVDEDNLALDSVNVEFLFKMSPKELDKFNKKFIKILGEEFKIDYDVDPVSLAISNSEKSVTINLRDKVLVYRYVSLNTFSINENYNIIFNHDLINHYEFIKTLLNELAKLYDSYQ